jgi:3-oxoacyl-ACP reductase-like protein
MAIARLVVGTILAGIGVIFIANSKALGEGMTEFYKKLYAKKNTPTMFKAAGVLLVIGGAILAFAPF